MNTRAINASLFALGFLLQARDKVAQNLPIIDIKKKGSYAITIVKKLQIDFDVDVKVTVVD